ncbi:tumor necrosis factor receptor superfamily member 5 isoform X2 [Cynoglossus semilaevis]|uniref:Tumor necrosis factor receptor superfamily member 5-like n=1 Tax=Cynoglossus semilaevis TaxID=244447 RepID=A0A3P8W7H3_CYNSE|nr:tumor necrosis factor receptor superfamily member 5-like isoform X2 [Cynoglossus semilaevis]
MLLKLDQVHLLTMRMKILVALVCADFALMTAAQFSCDPLTQYQRSGQCCQMCSPGTHMLSQSPCFEPRCSECGESEYQDKYNTDSKCQQQPYCDANRNFQVSTQDNKKKKISCMCLLGFHCSGEICSICVPHTTCKPGEGAVAIGNHTHDTVCQKCPEGSFSFNDSWESVCIKHTECGSGYELWQKGTAISDNVCERMTRMYIGLLIGFLFLVSLIVAACLYTVHVKRKKKSFDIAGENGHLAINNRHIYTPVDDPENEQPLFVTQISKEECGTRTPEENVDEGSLEEGSDSGVYTQKGNFLKQETGKQEILSLQEESQTSTVVGEGPQDSFNQMG